MIVKRTVKPGLDPALLARVDYTLISHMHLDHLSYGSLDMIPKNGALIFPCGLTSYIPDFGFNEYYEMAAWDKIERDSVRITAVPAQHFTGRYSIDRDWVTYSGYTGYIIEYKGVTVFFAGATGYNTDFFKEVGMRFKIDLAIIPIAPGSFNNLGSPVHTSPLGALAIFKDVGARYLMPIHFGTMLFGSNANPAGPVERLRSDAANQGISDKIVDLNIGGQRVIY
jgi:N-acyl-phosphatidylethanolamine-hydrolysing phospholipase D